MLNGSRNQVVDGLRGISVSLVLMGHMIGYRLARPDWLPEKVFYVLADLGGVGVSLFFAISGYLITTLLLAEEQKTSRVSLKAFYIRRAFRIMPAFYLFMIAVLLLWQAKLIDFRPDAALRSAVYTCNISGFSCSWWLAHTWSLAVEEQFYLTWPLLFVLLSRYRLAIATMAFVAVTLAAFTIPAFNGFPTILLGVLVALSPSLQAGFAHVPTSAIAIAGAMLLATPLKSNLLAPLQSLLVATVLFGTLFGSANETLRRAVQNPFLVRTGLISYSIYLWQQLSLAPAAWGGSSTGAERLYFGWGWISVFAFLPLAISSYFFVEQPFIRAGHRLSRRIIERDNSPFPTEASPPIPAA